MFKINDVEIGGKDLFFILGPCVIESEEHVIKMANIIKEISKSLNIRVIFKSSYDKANRTSLFSYRGPGIKEGLRILERVKKEVGLPITTDVHNIEEVTLASNVVDLIQLPAFLCRQTDLLVSAGKAKKPVNIKKGQFVAPHSIGPMIEKVKSAGEERVCITERGYTFGYNNLVVDMRSIQIMKSFNIPVIFDATHSVQLPGGLGDSSGGERQFVPTLARAAVAAGADGIFMECHDCPECALCDGPNSIPVNEVEGLLRSLIAIKGVINS
ncbi:MAG TPA: 3-deoxy-8-phosphooctulonate synthase [Thermodesulfobium narugense]|uniref:2-dehydro-3-deoxyphosphooctonate aldolase n=1 Tax=Thermodesulfobium acidiphilum TaxID=1794699 RepID=A0A2R4VY81_THEAF|nr:3-deoxy-8-phosphooctulonate synthase [Thermodesulfobium acidiphilum]AWB09452.1 2-dehydro-3-deoxyphosphooctonate aldolase (KDO 8-P synthase) [Thermodesulfobium acidiphilum]PMP85446.1 MAG: 3-deoxy-8-phosphooctulonate synthase [Thermodesulfobium narugense]HEM55378.1 3-deoxy-8-phosphooctulonate synthase [Thermodesulfobium narugense]